MKNIKVNQNNEEPFNPDEAFNQMLELYTKGINLDYSNKKEALKQSKEIRKEMSRLEKLRREYFKEKIAELKKKQ
ncbi:MAG: hypothetical protein NTZ85_01560 [Bacteroidia bacterium]|jgi:hypothetical protein|nr:hypothetical protein [Bacteroidia bacterium]